MKKNLSRVIPYFSSALRIHIRDVNSGLEYLMIDKGLITEKS